MVLISSAKGNKKFSYSVDISLWYGINIICDGGQCNGILFSSSRDDCTESISGFALLCHLWVMQSFLTHENEVCCPSRHQKSYIYEHTHTMQNILMCTVLAHLLTIRYTWSCTICSWVGLSVWLYTHNYIGLRAQFLVNEWIILTEDMPKDVFL